MDRVAHFLLREALICALIVDENRETEPEHGVRQRHDDLKAQTGEMVMIDGV